MMIDALLAVVIYCGILLPTRMTASSSPSSVPTMDQQSHQDPTRPRNHSSPTTSTSSPVHHVDRLWSDHPRRVGRPLYRCGSMGHSLYRFPTSMGFNVPNSHPPLPSRGPVWVCSTIQQKTIFDGLCDVCGLYSTTKVHRQRKGYHMTTMARHCQRTPTTST
jgi:hypothetical protein